MPVQQYSANSRLHNQQMQTTNYKFNYHPDFYSRQSIPLTKREATRHCKQST